MSKKKHVPTDEVNDSQPDVTESPEAMLRSLRARLEAIPRERVVSINVDVQAAAVVALAVCRFVAQDDVRARFDLLPNELFDHANLDDLPLLADAVIQAQLDAQRAKAQVRDGKLPTALVEEASELRMRMLELTEYIFRHDAKRATEVAAIRSGTSYLDLASGLVRLADLYRDEHGLVERDPINYRPEDEKRARQLAEQVRTALGGAQGQEHKQAADLVARAWTLLRDAYAEVRAAGLFLFRHEGDEAKFPSLHTNARAGRGKAKGAPVIVRGGDAGAEVPSGG